MNVQEREIIVQAPDEFVTPEPGDFLRIKDGRVWTGTKSWTLLEGDFQGEAEVVDFWFADMECGEATSDRVVVLVQF